MAWLQELNGERHLLGEAAFTIGRDPSSDLSLADDAKVSRTHAALEVRDDQWFVVDLGSRNGTWVNDRKVSEHPLRNGDRLRFGGTTFIYGIGVDPNVTEGEAPICDSGLGLSERERQVLRLVAEGRTDRAIGEELAISVSTVRSHLDRIRDKTGLRRRSELTRLALSIDRTPRS